MRLRLISQLLFIFFLASVNGQSQFGIEIKLSHLKTENYGHITGGHTWYIVTNEDDPHTISMSIGSVYKLNDKHLVKLHIGRHRNGRILSLIQYSDVFGDHNEYSMVNIPYTYIQLAPSYSYRLIAGKIVFPFELGFHLNKRINEGNIFFVAINKYNYDVFISAGIHYRFIPHLEFGLNGKYVRNLNEYQNKHLVWGTFAPIQYGIELSCQYYFEK